MKKLAIACVICWGCFGLLFLTDKLPEPWETVVYVLNIVGFVGGIGTGITLFVMAMINYAKRK